MRLITIVDAHCHLGNGVKRRVTIEELLCEMDKYRVDQAVLCPMEEYTTVRNREGNDFIINAVQAHPDRFMGLAVANPWYGETAARELRRALENGLQGLKLHPALQGFFPSDEIVSPLMEVAQEFQIPVYCHTGTPLYALPLQVAVLAESYPQVNFVIGHMGAADFSQEAMMALELSPNLFIETSKVTNFIMIKEVLDKYGAERVIFGSDFPSSTLFLELKKIDLLNLNSRQKDWLLGKSFLQLLRRKEKTSEDSRR